MPSIRLANNVTWMNTISPVTNTTCGKGSIVRKTNSPQNLELLFSCVLVVSLSHQ